MIPFFNLLSQPSFLSLPLFLSFMMAESGKMAAAGEGRRNREVVLQLYEALDKRDQERVQSLLCNELECWFHGPRRHQHMKRLLTGDDDDHFKYRIHSIQSFAPVTVIVEGSDLAASVCWVHAWTISDGIITQVREYFNTSVTVTLVAGPTGKRGGSQCLSVWKSKLAGKSFPSLVIPI